MLIARLEVLGQVDARGAVRFELDAATTLRIEDGAPIDVLIDNFSRTGFLFVADTDFPTGTLVRIGLSGAGSREARVVWRDGDRHGCEFLVPLPQSRMAMAFRGQAEVVADLQAALDRRFAVAQTEAPSAPEPNEIAAQPASAPMRTRILAELRRLFPGHAKDPD